MTDKKFLEAVRALVKKAENPEEESAASNALPPSVSKGGPAYALNVAIDALKSFQSKVQNGQMPDTMPTEVRRVFDELMTALGAPAGGSGRDVPQVMKSVTVSLGPAQFVARMQKEAEALLTDPVEVLKARLESIAKAVAIAKAEESWSGVENTTPKELGFELIEFFPGSAPGGAKAADVSVRAEQSTSDQSVVTPPVMAPQGGNFSSTEVVKAAVTELQSFLSKVVPQPGSPMHVQKSKKAFTWGRDLNDEPAEEKATTKKAADDEPVIWGRDPWEATRS